MPRRCCTGGLADVVPWSRCAWSAGGKPLNFTTLMSLRLIPFLPSPRLRPAPVRPIVAPPPRGGDFRRLACFAAFGLPPLLRNLPVMDGRRLPARRRHDPATTRRGDDTTRLGARQGG